MKVLNAAWRGLEMTRNVFSVELSPEQAEEVTREYLVDLLDEISVPFTDPKMIECVNRLIAWMSQPESWEGGKYDI